MILINASNLHVGGGVQVAASFLYEASLYTEYDYSDYMIVVSDSVHSALVEMEADLTSFNNYRILNTYGLKAFFSELNHMAKNAKVVFTIFGPNYLRTKSKHEIVGFAQSWIIYPDNQTLNKYSLLEKLKAKTKFYLQWLFFKRANHYIVELEHVKERLISQKKLQQHNISVVHNTVSSIFRDQKLQEHFDFFTDSNQINIGIVSRDYPHKNLAILPKVAYLLRNTHQLNVHFYVTFNTSEWKAKSSEYKKWVTTVGSLSPAQCPAFYRKMDGIIFPSLLECFSATPLEALSMQKPLFASDRGFVRDICNDFAIYFNPLDEYDIANKIARYYKLSKPSLNLSDAKKHALSFSSPKSRARKYLNIIDDIYNKTNY